MVLEKKSIRYWGVFKALMARDLKIMRFTLIPDCIDAIILIILQYINYMYFLPKMGMSTQLILPLFVGSVGSVLINSAFDRGITDSADVTFSHFIRYQMTLPLPLSWLFVQKMVMHMFNILVASLPALGLLIWLSSDIITLSGIILFGIVYILSLLFMVGLLLSIAYGTGFFWFIDNAWTRVLMPILFFGCTYFPWKAAYSTSAIIGSLYALSPLTYSVEGMRAALLGGDVYLSVYLCIGVLAACASVMIFVARSLFIRRLYA